ncbi:MAG: hypothetical protein COB02_01990 [Candidatus Cloacimonadota bacterium]|nr:MAG: hypothetical protein COB02_01990 [Candidatus Cloacimonadota bacterium]
MISILILFLFALLFGLILYIVKTPSTSMKKQRVAEIQEKIGEVYVPAKMNVADTNHTLEFEIHPLEQISLVQEKLTKYAEATASDIESDSEKAKFLQSMDITRLNLESFTPDELIKSLNSFAPIHCNYRFGLDNELNILSQKFCQLIYNLPSHPEDMYNIEALSACFFNFQNDLFDMVEQYQEFDEKNYPDDLIERLVENPMRIITTQELWEGECKSFFNWYYTVRCYFLMHKFYSKEGKSLEKLIARLNSILSNAKDGITMEDYQWVQHNQKQILDSFQNIYSLYQRFFEALLVVISQLQDSQITIISESKQGIEKWKEKIEDRYLPTAYGFLPASTSNEYDCGAYLHEFQNHIQKITSNKPSSLKKITLKIGIVESAQSFFNQRLRDSQNFLNSVLIDDMDKMLNAIFKQIK